MSALGFTDFYVPDNALIFPECVTPPTKKAVETDIYLISLDYVLVFCFENVTEAIRKFIDNNKYGYVYCGRFMLLLYCISTKMI